MAVVMKVTIRPPAPEEVPFDRSVLPRPMAPTCDELIEELMICGVCSNMASVDEVLNKDECESCGSWDVSIIPIWKDDF